MRPGCNAATAATFRLAGVALLASCSALTSFDATKAVESTAALCADGVDNDRDGLTDCQDWKCLSQRKCCNLPITILEETFINTCDCAEACNGSGGLQCALSADRWDTWGTPRAQVCQAGLVSCKVQNCYDVGVFSKPSVILEAGVELSVTFAGMPETRGRWTVGLTFQPESPRVSAQACAPVVPIQTVVGVQLIANEAGGSDLVPQFGASDLPRLRNLSGNPTNHVTITIVPGGRVSYRFGDGPGATTIESNADQVIPTTGQPVHVVMFGRGLTSHVTAVRLTHGARCEDPTTWRVLTTDDVPPPAPLFAGGSNSWDGLAVFRPSAALSPLHGELLLAYAGCSDAGFSTCAYNDGAVAIALNSGQGFIPNTCGFVSSSGASCLSGAFTSSPPYRLFDNTGNYYDADIGFVADPAADHSDAQPVLAALISQPIIQAGFGGESIVTILSRETPTSRYGSAWDTYPQSPRLQRGPAGSWDSAEVCCASLDGHAGFTIWYSGRGSDGIWRIGQAVLGPDGRFVKNPANPVITEGASGAADQRGASDPEVVWDDDPSRRLYRMWYVAHDSVDQTSIAMATSTDGVRWNLFPRNPIIRASQIGLRTVANPTVIGGERGLRMWVDGEGNGEKTRIYEIRNEGASPGP
jgi:hypothetical protein